MMKAIYCCLVLLISVLFISCATSDKGFNKASLEKNEEFEQVIKIEKIESSEEPEESSVKKAPIVKEKSKPKKKVKKKATVVKKEKKKNLVKKKETLSSKKKKPVKKQPSLEDSENFEGRRPSVDPYRVGEEIVLGVSYFAVEAGKFTMRVKPMVQVNGRKSYHFQYVVKSSPLFSMFYSANDVAETFVDYETMVPYSYEIHVDESKQVRETRTFFDHKKNKATMWDKKKKPGQELEERKLEWDLKSYSQNVFSAAYYLRAFTLRVGKELKIRVGHEGKNIIMTAKVLRKEKIYTDLGAFDTFVVKPSFDIDGKFKPTGENLLWLTADDRKFIVRLESKIKIGTIVGKLQKLKK